MDFFLRKVTDDSASGGPPVPCFLLSDVLKITLGSRDGSFNSPFAHHCSSVGTMLATQLQHLQ